MADRKCNTFNQKQIMEILLVVLQTQASAMIEFCGSRQMSGFRLKKSYSSVRKYFVSLYNLQFFIFHCNEGLYLQKF